MAKTLKCFWCRSVVHINKYLAKLGPMSGERKEQSTSLFCGYSAINNNEENNPALAGSNNSNSFHYIPTICNSQYGRGLQESINPNAFPQIVIYPSYPVPNYAWNPYFNSMHYYHTNIPPENINYYGADQINSQGRYFHRNVDHRSRNRHMGLRYDNERMLGRQWQKVDKPSSSPGFIFTLMSYNVLAQDLLENHPYLYQEHDQQSLNWHTRWNNLLEEIKQFMPDILCLQEVQESHIEKYYSSLQALGYEGLFKKRTGNQCDGCAIYYKTENLILKNYTFVEYFKPIVSVLNRDNIGIVAKLAPKMFPNQEFVIATTHLLFNRRRNDVRMAQMQLLLTEIEKVSYKKEQKKSVYLPIILTGDLNSPPESDLYEFITKGALKYEQLSPRLLAKNPESLNGRVLVTSSLGITDKCQHTELLDKRFKAINISEEKSADDLQTEIDNNLGLESTGVLSHGFDFKSVYVHNVNGNFRNVREGTTFQDEWLTVDYIFYSGNKEENNKIKLLARYMLPTINELNNVRIPNQILGSDHFSLTAKFKLGF